jgi:hypothetical protein
MGEVAEIASPFVRLSRLAKGEHSWAIAVPARSGSEKDMLAAVDMAERIDGELESRFGAHRTGEESRLQEAISRALREVNPQDATSPYKRGRRG